MLELKIWTKDRARGKDVDPTSVPVRVSLLASHDHLRAKRRYLADVQAIKKEFSPAIQSTGNINHSLVSSLLLYYAGGSEVPPRIFGPLGPKTLRGQLSLSLSLSLTITITITIAIAVTITITITITITYYHYHYRYHYHYHYHYHLLVNSQLRLLHF